MPYSEFLMWATYVEIYGPVSLPQRIDHAAALIAYTASAVAGGKSKYREFLQYPPPPPVDDFDGMTDMDRQLIEAFG